MNFIVKIYRRSPSRIIHKAKGDEFYEVLVDLTDPYQLRFLTHPTFTSEEKSVFYIAASRAKNRLFITSQKLSEENENKINYLVEVIRIT
jgi:superfamily I DNA/RNA helicase